MSRRNRGALALATLLSLASPSSHAQAVICTHCATELTQLANNLQLIDQLARQVELVREAIRQSENLALNTEKLSSQDWGSTLDEIRRVNALLADAKSLSFTSAGLEAGFAERYQGYRAYAEAELGPEQLAAKYQQWSEETNASVLSTLKAAGLTATQIEGEEEIYLKSLEALAETAKGRMQAIEVGNQIALAAARQTQKLRQLMLVQIQLVANFIQRQGDREAVEAARWQKFTKPIALPTGRNGRP
jgi:P-type conjugative transfer protein TrbJ